jgi:hypothetical protein
MAGGAAPAPTPDCYMHLEGLADVGDGWAALLGGAVADAREGGGRLRGTHCMAALGVAGEPAQMRPEGFRRAAPITARVRGNDIPAVRFVSGGNAHGRPVHAGHRQRCTATHLTTSS